MQTLKRTAIPTALAATLILVIFFLTSLSSRSTLAQALDKVKEAKSLRYKQLITIPNPSDPQKTITLENICTIVSPSWTCTEMPYMGDTTTINDYATGKSLTLVPQDKIAVRMNLPNVPNEKQKDLLEQLRNVDVKNAKLLGEELLDGRKTKKYQITPKEPFAAKLDQKVWIDDETHLPVRMEMKMDAVAKDPKMHNVFTDFQWNVQVDQALLNFEIPEGYQVLDRRVILPVLQDLLTALKETAEFYKGKFPDELSFDKSSSYVRLNEITGKTGTPATKTVDLSTYSTTGIRAIQFMNAGGTDWHYAGKGASLNDKDRPILWYRPKDKETYRVIDATLNVKEVTPADLPKIGAVKIDPAKLMLMPATQPSTTSQP